MNTFTIYVAALLIGVIAGLRTFTAPAAVSWAAHLGSFSVAGTRLAFMGSSITAWIFTVLALAEILLIDPKPTTPSRKKPGPFAGRIVTGALSGAAITIGSRSWVIGAILGIIGAILGTLGGADGRSRLARRFRRDRPAALLEDVSAIVGAALIVTVLA
jgi:uncharacterized membrane protein